MTSQDPLPDIEQVQIETVWPSDVASLAQLVNQFVVIAGPPAPDGSPDGAYVAFGHVSPPVMGSRIEMDRFLAETKGHLAVIPRAAVYLTNGRLEELAAQLNAHVARFKDA